MIVPALQGTALLHDIRDAAHDTDRFHVWWLGQSGFLIQWQRHHLLLDPYLSDSLTEKYATTDKPHVRMTELVIEPQRLDFIDLVTSSHNHTDHLDAITLSQLRRVNRHLSLIVPKANRAFAAERLGIATTEIEAVDVGASITRAGFTLHPIPAAHETLDRDDQGSYRYVGYVVQFGPWTIYHSGDTILYDDLAERLRAWPIDLALLPINGRGPERRVSGNLWGREAAWLAHAIDARDVIPCHYDMFTFNTATPDEFIAECHKLQQPYHVVRCGERWSSPRRL